MSQNSTTSVPSAEPVGQPIAPPPAAPVEASGAPPVYVLVNGGQHAVPAKLVWDTEVHGSVPAGTPETCTIFLQVGGRPRIPYGYRLSDETKRANPMIRVHSVDASAYL